MENPVGWGQAHTGRVNLGPSKGHIPFLGPGWANPRPHSSWVKSRCPQSLLSELKNNNQNPQLRSTFEQLANIIPFRKESRASTVSVGTKPARKKMGTRDVATSWHTTLGPKVEKMATGGPGSSDCRQQSGPSLSTDSQTTDCRAVSGIWKRFCNALWGTLGPREGLRAPA